MGYKAYGCGGTNHSNCLPNDTPTFYEYDLSDNVWTTRTSRLYNTCAHHGEGAAYDDVYVWGAHPEASRYKTTKWDTTGLSWSDVADMPVTVSYGHFPTFGGYMWTGGACSYDYVNNIWRADFGYWKSSYACFEINGYLYMCGDDGESYDGCRKYDVNSQVWSVIADKYSDLPYDNGRGGAGDGVFGYIFGGGSAARETYYGQTERYDSASNTWLRRSGTKTPARHSAGYRIDDKIYAFGGYNCPGGCCGTNSHQEYSDATQAWISKASFPEANNSQIGMAPPVNKPPNAPTSLSVSIT